MAVAAREEVVPPEMAVGCGVAAEDDDGLDGRA
jgi:hypothetical protein